MNLNTISLPAKARPIKSSATHTNVFVKQSVPKLPEFEEYNISEIAIF
jgi:hypothetical protein